MLLRIGRDDQVACEVQVRVAPVWLLEVCFLREAPERAIGSDRRRGQREWIVEMRNPPHLMDPCKEALVILPAVKNSLNFGHRCLRPGWVKPHPPKDQSV